MCELCEDVLLTEAERAESGSLPHGAVVRGAVLAVSLTLGILVGVLRTHRADSVLVIERRQGLPRLA